MEYLVSLPETTIEGFYKHLEEGRLMASKCVNCGKTIFPPRPLCPYCYSTSLEWRELSREGEVVSYTVIHVAPRELQQKTPYIVAVVKLKEDVKTIGIMEDISPEEVRVGLKVEVNVKREECETWPVRPRIVFTPKPFKA